MPERNCADCTKQLEFGCFAERLKYPPPGHQDVPTNWYRPATLPTTINGEVSFACPRQTIKEQPREWRRLFMFYNMFKNGFLPDPGAVVDQSNSLLEALRIIDDENASAEKALAEKAAAKGARKGKGRKS